MEMDRIRGTPNVVRQTLLLSGLLAPGCAGRGKGCAPSPASGCWLSVLQLGSAGRDAEGSAGRQKEPSSDPVPLPQRNPGKGNWGWVGEFSLGAPAAVPAPMMEKSGTGEVSTPAAGGLEGAWEHPQTSLGGVSGSGRAALRRNWAPRQCRREPALWQRGGFAPLGKRSHRLHGGQEAQPGGEQGSSRGHPAWGCHRCVGGSAGGWVGAGCRGTGLVGTMSADNMGGLVLPARAPKGYKMFQQKVAGLLLGETCKSCLFNIFFPFYPRIWIRITSPLTPWCANPSRRSSSMPTCFQPGSVRRSEGSGPGTTALHGTLGMGHAWGHRDRC